MKNIAPDILRQRPLIEANYSIPVDADVVRKYLLELAAYLNLRTYGDSIIHSPSGEGKIENQGFDAFVPLIDSGISLYIWSNKRFMFCVIYTCKAFSVEKSLQFTKEFFITSEMESQEF